MKRSLVLLGLVVLVAAGCGGGGTKPSAGTTTQGGKQVKVGLVPDVSGLNDRGFNHLSYVGLLRAQRELGIEPSVYHSNAQLDYLPNMTTLARKGYDLTIAVGYTEATAVDTAATNFPNSKFAIVDGEQTQELQEPKDQRRLA